MVDDAGILPVRKPVGLSTYDIVRMVKRQGARHVGHGGTLDPFASGIVLILLGNATKRFREVISWPKTYIAGIRLGATSTTLDIAGDIMPVAGADPSKIARGTLEETLKGFVGQFEQRVPAFAAAKHHGQPLYRLARQGVMIEKSKTVRVDAVDLLTFRPPYLTLRVISGGGFYVRQMSQDIGEKLGCGAFLYALERIRIGKYRLQDCRETDEISALDLSVIP